MLHRMEMDNHGTTTARAAHTRQGVFRKVGENLYRYSSNRRYYAVFRVNGKLFWKSLATADREMANRKLKDELEKQGKIDADAANMSLSTLLDLYEKRLQQYDAKTIETRTWILKTFKETWKHGLDITVGDVTKTQLELWLAPHRARLAKSSFNEFVIFVRQLFQIAIDARVLVDSPAGFKQLKRDQPIRVTPNWKQFLDIVKHLRGYNLSYEVGGKTFVMELEHDDSADLIEFMGKAGVGTAECANLRGEHIDFKAKTISLYRSKTDTGYTIPLFPQVAPLLYRLKKEGKIAQGKRVFTVRDPKKALAHACRRLNFPHFTPRSLRRCFITRAVEKGVDFKTLAAWQGHRDGGVLIARTYSHLRSEHSARMAKKL